MLGGKVIMDKKKPYNGARCGARSRFTSPTQAFRKLSRSALMVSASVVGMPCGNLVGLERPVLREDSVFFTLLAFPVPARSEGQESTKAARRTHTPRWRSTDSRMRAG